VSGLGEACSHAAGLLFALHDFRLSGFHALPDSDSTTDVLCRWSKPSEKRKVEAVPISQVPVRKAISGGRKERTKWERETHLSKYDPRRPQDRKVSVEQQAVKTLMEGLRASIGGCGLLRNYDNTIRSSIAETNPSPEPVVTLPDLTTEFDPRIVPAYEVTALQGEASASSTADLVQERQDFLFSVAGVLPILDTETVDVDQLKGLTDQVLEKIALTAEQREELESSTRGQSSSSRWHAEHVGRITASVAPRAMNASKSITPDKFVRDIMRYNNKKERELRWDDPREHGLRLEPLARRAYMQHKREEGITVQVEERGLIASGDYPFLATSTDGLITEEGMQGNGVLEIKCPVSKDTIQNLAREKKNFFLLPTSNGGLELKESHPYYTQVQFEMAITGCSWADFVVFTLPEEEKDEDVFVQRVHFSVSFWQTKLLPALSSFFSKCLVLELATRRVLRNVPLLG